MEFSLEPKAEATSASAVAVQKLNYDTATSKEIAEEVKKELSSEKTPFTELLIDVKLRALIAKAKLEMYDFIVNSSSCETCPLTYKQAEVQRV